MKEKEVCKKILELCEEESIKDNWEIRRAKDECKKILFHYELLEKYGLDIKTRYINCENSVRIDRNSHQIRIAIYGDGKGRICNIKNQPKDELLLEISFPIGAYMFGEDYPKELFEQFYEELKTYNPKYEDHLNNCLYYEIDKAKDIFNKYPEIFEKYKKMYDKQWKDRRKQKLLEELESLEENNE